ncbi:hypothetical protein B9G54_00770 [Alloscardovia macacae]|uniref:Serralysin n=1 Tax=Alloscardovia macacae TaxID=1160091 RepID=A0A1Y2SWF6_9BIFI|nr:hypothetical protein B9G54_00770 [Alloscardovia macacae]OTA30284.1 hypothetical protein B9T39_00850 [Alloscardovia macacae]
MWKHARYISFTKIIPVDNLTSPAAYAHREQALTASAVNARLEDIIRSAWEKNAQHFPHVQASDVLSLISHVGEQGVASSRGGKRLRALLLDQTARTFTKPEQRADLDTAALRDLACAIEIFQTAALIHDDIMDAADTRRGAPSAHKALEALTKNPQQAQGLALMLGDLLATLSIRTAHSASANLPHGDAIFHAFLDMHDQVELGQIMDVSMESLDLSSHADTEKFEDSITATYLNKTASYTTVAPMLMGGLAAGSPLASHLAHDVGSTLGLAFQIHDDLLDLVSTQQKTGKPLYGDIREGKRTYILAQALKRANAEDRAFLVQQFMRDERTPQAIQQIRAIFLSTGAIDAAVEKLDELWTQAAHEVLAACMSQDVNPEDAQQYISFCQRFVA